MVCKEAWITITSWDLFRKSLVVRCTYQTGIYADCSLLVLSSLAVVCLAHLYFHNVVY